MKTFSIKMCDGPYQPENHGIVSVAGDSATVEPSGDLSIKAGDDTVLRVAAGRWNYYQVQQEYELDALKKAV